MIVTYAPEPGPGESRQEPRSWEFEPAKIRMSRAQVIQKLAGVTWEEWAQRVRGGDAKALCVLLWHLLSLEHPTLQLKDVPDFAMGELQVTRSRAEYREMMDQVRGSREMDETQRQQMLIGLDMEMQGAPQLEPEEPEREGKADVISPTSEIDTGLTSPSYSTSHPMAPAG